jgi:SAM-dependent methyltransferase
MIMETQVERAKKSLTSLCTVCGGDQWEFVRRGRDLYQPEDTDVFTLDRCLLCGQVMQNPLPTAEQLIKGYSADYAPYQPAWKQKGWPLWKILRSLTTWRRVRRVKRYGKGKQVMEVGCGGGDFLRAMDRAGWTVKGVEYSTMLADMLRNELGFDVRSGNLKTGIWEYGTFDAVVMWSVLEHLSNPIEALRLASVYLKPGGTLFIQIPTLYGIEQGNEFQDCWALLDLPRHLSFFDKSLLSDLCEKAGMKLTVFKTPLLDTAWCYFASLSSYARHSVDPLRRIEGLFSLGLVSFLSFPAIILRTWRNRGTEAFAVAVKR